MNGTLGNLLVIVLALMGASVIVAIIGLLALAHSIRRLHIPREADFFTTMRHVPLALAVLLDLLDFGLDIFSAPIIWIALDRMGLPNLRNKATIEALIPLTNVIPTFTVSWFAARLLNLGEPLLPAPHDQYGRPYAHTSRGHEPTIIDMDDYR
ncbi:MAG: hypothetical protein ACJ8CR_31885 [Roseiflexaceae bacterium]